MSEETPDVSGDEGKGKYNDPELNRRSEDLARKREKLKEVWDTPPPVRGGKRSRRRQGASGLLHPGSI